MIGFDLSEDHQSVESLVRELVAKEVAPNIAEQDARHFFDRTISEEDGGDRAARHLHSCRARRCWV